MLRSPLTTLGLSLIVLARCAPEAAAPATTPATPQTTTPTPGMPSTSTPSNATPAPPPPAPRCGDGHVDPDEACDDGNTNAFDGCRNDCTAVAPLTAPAREWTWIAVEGTSCMNGDTAGFGISINPASPDLMIYLEGGGACFNDACDFSAFNVPFVPPLDGIFNRDDAANPVRDWTMIYVPYCTGDIYAGDADTTLAGRVRHFHGYTNVTRFLERIVPAFPEREHVLLTGISAGGFGASINFAQVADAFGPGPALTLVDDSGPPLDNTVIAPCLEETFRAVWGLDRTLLAACGADCTNQDDFATGMMAHVLRRYPTAHYGFYSSTADTVIRTFMGFGWGNGTLGQCTGVPTATPAAAYESALLNLRASHGARASTYFVGQARWQYEFGRGHTVLRTPTYVTTAIDDVSVEAWLGRVIAGERVHVGP